MYFKYTVFFVENVNGIFQKIDFHEITVPEILLPIGISFIVFQKITYCLDIRSNKAKPAESFAKFIEYLFVFPQIIAGPIVKYNILAPQLSDRTIKKENIIYAVRRFSIGLFKKVWIADVLSKYADLAFNGSAGLIPVHYVWFGAVCYMLQIYFDFSAYSDMAIGLLRFMGFTIPENFNLPYISKSFTEFWKRWHISLTSWFREYIYIPLGGSKRSKIRTYINLWIVFIISGFWHGANWNFIFWGIYHGAFLSIERMFLLRKMEKVPSVLRIIFTSFLILTGWVFFRSSNLISGFEYLKQMFNFNSFNIHTPPERIMYVDNHGIFIFILSILICLLPAFEKQYMHIKNYFVKHNKISLYLCLIIFCLAAFKVGTGSISPFIYFMF